MFNKNYFKIKFCVTVFGSLFLFSNVLAAGGAAQQAGKAFAGAGIAIGGNIALGKIFTGICDKPSGQYACPMAAASFAQAIMTAGTASDASTTKSGFQSSRDFNSGFGDGGSGGSAFTADENRLLLEANQNLNALAKKGYKVDKKTGEVTTPKGKVPNSAFASGKAMADAGLISPDEIAGVDEMIRNAIKDVPKIVSMGVGGSGGGGGGSGGKASSYSYDDPYKSYYGSSEKPNDPRTAGLTRNLASGESIGAQTDNLFEMVKRRYQQKSEEKIFVGQ